MNSYSNKELRTLAARAAKGAYMPWGLAEDAAASLAWLERYEIPAILPFVDLLTVNDGKDAAELVPVFGRDKTGGRNRARICPIMAGAYLSDLKGANLNDGSLEIENVNSPILLVPFLVWVARDLDRSLWVQWGRVLAHVGGEGIEIKSGKEDLELSTLQDVVITFAAGDPEPTQATRPRSKISNRNRLILDQFVQRTLLPESELSKASGAGGARIDDE